MLMQMIQMEPQLKTILLDISTVLLKVFKYSIQFSIKERLCLPIVIYKYSNIVLLKFNLCIEVKSETTEKSKKAIVASQISNIRERVGTTTQFITRINNLRGANQEDTMATIAEVHFTLICIWYLKTFSGFQL